VFATLARADSTTRTRAEDLAKRHQLVSLATPDDVAKLLAGARQDYGSDEGAVLAVFAGHEVTRFAVQRAKAEGAEPTLEALARQLPPETPALIQASSALALGTALGLAWPVPPDTRITSPFGWRWHPILGRSQYHTGVDLAVPVGSPVRAAADGVVRRASEDAVNGRVVIIDHGHGVSTALCHNSQLLVSTGQRITQGQVVAFSGSTGRSTGPHVHFQVELSGTPVDPLALKGKGETPTLAQKPKAAPALTRPTNRALKAAFDRAAVVEASPDDDGPRDGESAAPAAQP
jgi:murein DD-endopeptidase